MIAMLSSQPEHRKKKKKKKKKGPTHQVLVDPFRGFEVLGRCRVVVEEVRVADRNAKERRAGRPPDKVRRYRYVMPSPVRGKSKTG